MGQLSPTTDIRVGVFLRDWVIADTGSDTLHLDKTSNLWGIVVQNLSLPPLFAEPAADRSEFISVQLRDLSQPARWNIPSNTLLHLNTNSRWTVSEAGQAAVRRWLENQLRSSFCVYMVARYSDSDDEPIRHAISSFLLDFHLPLDDKMIARLAKYWYRYRVKNPVNYRIPIFF